MKFSLIKKILICTPVLAAVPATIVPAVQTTSNQKVVKANKTMSLVNSIRPANVCMTPYIRKHGLDCGYARQNWEYLYWDRVSDGSDASFEASTYNSGTNQLTIKTDGENNNDRFIYHQIRIDVEVPPKTKDFLVNFQADCKQWWHWNCHFCGSQYQSSVQMFDLGDDENAHPDRFNNFPQTSKNPDSRSIMEWGWFEKGVCGRTRESRNQSRILNWKFTNDTNTTKNFTKYIGVSFWIGGQKESTNGDVRAELQTTFNVGTNQGYATYDLCSSLKRDVDDRNIINRRANSHQISWADAQLGSEKPGFEDIRWCDQNRLLIRSEGHSTHDRIAYQQIKVNVIVPANVKNYKVSFKADFHEWCAANPDFTWNRWYDANTQLFDFGEDANAHPEKFYHFGEEETDKHSIMKHKLAENWWTCNERTFDYASKPITWTFNNNKNAPQTFTKYIGLSYWILGARSPLNGKVKGDIKVRFIPSFPEVR